MGHILIASPAQLRGSNWADVSGPKLPKPSSKFEGVVVPERRLDRTAMADGRSDSVKEEEEAKVRILIEKGKERKKEMIDKDKEKSPTHDKETHGTSNDIGRDTPIEQVKGPGVLERAKEEIEAVVEAIHPKK
ncbi:unnamed protein product [Lactuca virosa]|uniref:Uncharacterized protein n=1 Tax=Lactuca virosa TaxID=75947 RepID=A0AAU9NWT9_9ASTR|nr:unnamed protein product [Lactuca virosa]